MDETKTDRISRRAYEIWESEGRPEGRHDEHWLAAERESGDEAPTDAGGVSHPGMMGDGTEEQNLDQPGQPDARITEEEVQEAFGGAEEGAAAKD